MTFYHLALVNYELYQMQFDRLSYMRERDRKSVIVRGEIKECSSESYGGWHHHNFSLSLHLKCASLENKSCQHVKLGTIQVFQYFVHSDVNRSNLTNTVKKLRAEINISKS